MCILHTKAFLEKIETHSNMLIQKTLRKPIYLANVRLRYS